MWDVFCTWDFLDFSSHLSTFHMKTLWKRYKDWKYLSHFMLLRCQPLKRTIFVCHVAKIRIPLSSCYLLFYYAQTLNTSMQFNTPLQFPTSCLKNMKSSACNLMTIFVKDVCCLKFCWNTSFFAKPQFLLCNFDFEHKRLPLQKKRKL